jgi:putative component of toxin-antitoxin plasmid stabilization module
MKVQEYIREDGSSPYKKWFDKLDPMAAAKVTVAKSRLELGNTSKLNGSMELANAELIGGQDIVFI